MIPFDTWDMQSMREKIDLQMTLKYEKTKHNILAFCVALDTWKAQAWYTPPRPIATQWVSWARMHEWPHNWA